MTADALVRGLGVVAGRVAAEAVSGAREALARRVAVVVPEAAIAVGDDAVRVTGRGLVARAFGSRRRAADPRLLAMVSGDGA